jgi:hypothetical protein
MIDCPLADTCDRAIAAALAEAVYETCLDATESFEHNDLVGPDLAYLLGAILKGTACGWPADRPLVALLRAAFPDPSHPVWDHISIEDPTDDE